MKILLLVAVIAIIALMASESHFDGICEVKRGINRMADKSRQKALKRPLKRSAKYTMVWAVRKVKP